jgi:hypothetical protein
MGYHRNRHSTGLSSHASNALVIRKNSLGTGGKTLSADGMKILVLPVHTMLAITSPTHTSPLLSGRTTNPPQWESESRFASTLLLLENSEQKLTRSPPSGGQRGQS